MEQAIDVITAMRSVKPLVEIAKQYGIFMDHEAGACWGRPLAAERRQPLSDT